MFYKGSRQLFNEIKSVALIIWFTATMLTATPALAGTDYVGDMTTIHARAEDTLTALAQRYEIGYVGADCRQSGGGPMVAGGGN